MEDSGDRNIQRPHEAIERIPRSNCSKDARPPDAQKPTLPARAISPFDATTAHLLATTRAWSANGKSANDRKRLSVSAGDYFAIHNKVAWLHTRRAAT